MITIKFSHYYRKMEGFDLTQPFMLVNALKTHYKKLRPGFIDYDTEYDGGHYVLPKTDLLLLTLMQENNIDTMTTIRRWTSSKEKYYRNLVGQQIMCEIIRP